MFKRCLAVHSRFSHRALATPTAVSLLSHFSKTQSRTRMKVRWSCCILSSQTFRFQNTRVPKHQYCKTPESSTSTTQKVRLKIFMSQNIQSFNFDRIIKYSIIIYWAETVFDSEWWRFSVIILVITEDKFVLLGG